MPKLLIKTAVLLLRLIYLPLRPFKLRDRVLILSRQSDTPGLDIRLITEELARRRIETVVLCRKTGDTTAQRLRYCFHVLRQLRYLATSRTVVLDGYCIAASVLPKKRGQRTVQIWHAMAAIKKFGWQNAGSPDGRDADTARLLCMHRGYDAYLAPCAVTGDIFAEAFGTARDKCVYLCLPRVDYLLSPMGSAAGEMYDAYPVLKEKINVLYCPTFRKGRALKLDKLVSGFDFGQFNLIIKKHPLDDSDYSWAETAGAVVDTAFSSMDWLKLCDKLVTDYSAISIEAAAMERELYILRTDAESYSERVGLNIDLGTESIAPFVCDTEEELFEALRRDYDRDALLSFKKKYVQAPTYRCTERLCDYILSL